MQQAVRTGKNSVLRNDRAMLLLRLYLRMKADASIAHHKYYTMDGRKISFSQLDDKLEETMSTGWGRQTLRDVVTDLRTIMPLDASAAADMRSLLSKLLYHGVRVRATSMMAIGFAVYVETAGMTHSCRPTAAAVWNGNLMQVRAMTIIPVGKKASISLVDLSLRTEERRKLLSDRYFMYCKCIRCEKKDDPRPIPSDKTSHISAPGSKGVQEPLNIQIDKWTDALSGLKQTHGEYHPLISVHMVVFAHQLIQSGCRDKGSIIKVRKWFASLKQALTVTHGPEHQLFRDFEKIFTTFKL